MENTQFKLIIEDDEGRRSVVPVEVGEVTIGRAANSTIRLNERNVSRSHTILWAQDGQILARDLDSYNGTWVNGERLAEAHLVRKGDLLRIGDFQVELCGEGLPKPDEATDKTVFMGTEMTQPGVRLELVDEDTVSVVDQGVLRQEQAANLDERTLEDLIPDDALTPSNRAEKTAIIRMSAYEEVLASGPDKSSVSVGDRARLICVSSQFAGEEFEISQREVVIGRTEDNDIAIDHRSVSRHHAKLTFEEDRYSISDLTSANGTLVNGEEYARVELKHGDLIELGHVKFRFVPRGEGYTFSDDELDLIAPPVESTRRATASLPGQVEPVNSRVFTLDSKVVVGLGAGIVTLIVVGFALLFSGESRDSPKRSLAPQEEVADSVAVAKIIERAEVAYEKRHWSQVEVLANAALELEPTSARALDLLEQSGKEERMMALFDKAKTYIRDGNWSSAWNALSDIDKASVYASEAELLREQVRGGLISERISETKEAIASRDWDRATGLVDEILGLQPERPEIRVFRDAINAGRIKSLALEKGANSSVEKKETGKSTTRKLPKSALGTKSASKVSPKTPSKVSAKSPPKSPPKSSPQKIDSTESGSSASPDLAAVSAAAKDYYAGGVKALNQGAFKRSIEQFSKCIQADKAYGLCYRAMGITYARMQNGPKAARYYRLYLKVNPTAKDAPRVREFLKQYDGQ